MNLQLQMRNVLFIMLLLIVVWQTPICQALVISEIMYHPVEEGGTPQGEQWLEFIELYNDRAVFEDLSGYSFDNDIEYTFPAGTILGAKEYLVIAKDPNIVETTYGITGVLGPYDRRLNDDGDRIELWNEGGELILTFRFNDARPWTMVPDGTGHSLILAKLGGDPEEASTWAPSTYIGGSPGGPDEIHTPGDPDPELITLIDIGHSGRYFKGVEEPSPGGGGVPTLDWAQIAFDDNPATTDWIDGPSGYGYTNSDPDELPYINTTLSDMNGNYISFYARLSFTLTQEQINSFTELRAEVHYDDDYILFLNGTPVGNSMYIPEIPLAYNWERGSGTDYSTAYHDLTGWMNLLEVGENILAIQVYNSSLSGSSDCVGAPVLKAVLDDSGTTVDPYARLVVNEVLANSEAPPATDWIELYNPGPDPVDLDNIYLSDDRFDLLKYKLPNGTLPPGNFLVIDEGTPPTGFPFGIGYSDEKMEKIYVTLATGDPIPLPVRVLDVFRPDNSEPEITSGRYPDGSDYVGILSSSTRGYTNTPRKIHDIVINEIMYQHGLRDRRYEYIELYNRSTTETISMEGWEFTDGVTYVFPSNISMPPNSYLVIAEDPTFLDTKYPPGNNLELGVNLLGPYSGNLDDHSERIQLCYSYTDPNTQLDYLAIADEVTYYDGGRWPSWADGDGASLELLDPDSDNDTPDAWADSDESGKSSWQEINFSIESNDSNYTHDTINVFGLILLNRGEVLLDDIQLIRNDDDQNPLLSNSDFESGISPWNLGWVSNYNLNLGGNHIRSYISTEDNISGFHCLHLIATGHGDPGANRINQVIYGYGGKITFKGWARWLRGSRFLLLRTSNDQYPIQPPRPAYVKELAMPVNLGTPGLPNSTLETNRGPDIREIQHAPVLPTANDPIVVTARVTDNDGVNPVNSVTLYYRTEGSSSFTPTSMVDNGSGNDLIEGDGLFTGTIPVASAGTRRAFYIVATDESGDIPIPSTRFPALLPPPEADVPDRTCLVRVGDSTVSTPFATYRVWISDDVINAFTSRPNLSNELMDCTFVYNDTEVFYNTQIRFRGSPFLRGYSGWSPTGEHGYRIEFNPDRKFRMRQEINIDNTEDDGRGPLQERASYWFYRKMGLQFSMQEYIKPILNGNDYYTYEDVQKIDGDYIDAWFPNDNDGYIHKIDDYFEYNVQGTEHSNWDEGLIYNASHHPLIKETYRWGFEKRSHRENDEWSHLFYFAYAMNTDSSNSAAYEAAVESKIDPLHFARVLAIRHACGDWDSYGYRRGKNNLFYYAPIANRWYLLPWDIDFTLGSGDGSGTDIYYVETNFNNTKFFPEVKQFLNYPKYRAKYNQALEELVYGPWQTSYGTADPPTPFDVFLEDADNALSADGYTDPYDRFNGIKSYVSARQSYIKGLLPDPPDFEITTNSGLDFCTSEASVTLEGIAPYRVADITVNDEHVPVVFSENNAFEITVDLDLIGLNLLTLQGLNSLGEPIEEDTDSITIKRIDEIVLGSVTPNLLCNDGPAQLTIYGNNFEPGSTPDIDLSLPANEIGFDALYVKSFLAFDGIGQASLLLDNPESSSEPAVYGWHPVLNLFNSGVFHGEFPDNESTFYPPYDSDNFNFAVRFTGYIEAPSPGIRYFGVNSDEGFSLTINGELVGSYPGFRTAATTDVTNVTIGTMTYDFPAAGRYYLVLDYFEKSQGECIEFFQTNENGLDRRLINVDSELTVYGDDLAKVSATDVTVTDPNTITCQVDLTGVPATLWNIIVTPDCDQANRFFLEDVLLVTEPTTGSENWDVWPADPVVTAGLPDGTFEPNQITFEVVNLSMNSITWTIAKAAPCDWLDLPEVYYGTTGPSESAPVSVSLNDNAKTKPLGVYSCLLNFSIGCDPGGLNQYQREVQLVVTNGADFNRDTLVNLLDLKQLTDRWGNVCSPSEWCDWIDLDFSGRIDLGDYAILAQQWLQDVGQP